MTRLSVCRSGWGIALGVGLCLAGCARTPPSGPETEPPPVTVSYPLERDITDYGEYPGRVAAVDSVQVRARVSGYLEKIHFRDGTEVKQGDVLYEIDPRPYAAALRQAKAQVDLYQAQLKYNQAVYERNQRLMNAGQAVDVETVQQSLAQRDTTRAQLEAAQASVQQAQLNLDWTKVRAEIGGLIGRTLITRGNLVTADQTLLTTLVSQDPMYAYFEVDEPTALHVRALIRAGKFKSAREPGNRVPVYLSLSNEEGFPHEGYLDFINNQVTTSTGTLQLRGVFANPMPSIGPRVLAAGLFGRIRVPISAAYRAVLVTQAAVGTDQNLKFVYVVSEHNRVESRDVQLGTQQGSLWVVQSGLTVNERVVVNGLQHVRPGIEVKPRLVPMPGEQSVVRGP
jgi:RND family efflux transporter MFP subunit